jgi:carbon monoxide dehydrogenase subunit G
MAWTCKSDVLVPGTPESVFPWLVETDKVPQWMSGLRRYEQAAPGPLTAGATILQAVDVAGQQFAFELEVTAWRPPSGASLAFAASGFKAVNHYAVAPEGDGTRVTWSIDGDTTSFKAKLIAPVVQAKLQEKLEKDLVRLRELLGGGAAV